MSNEPAIAPTELIGRRVQLDISDPWDADIEAPIFAVIVAVKQHMLSLRLDATVTYRQQDIVYLVATPRHVGHDFDRLLDGHATPANFIPAPSTGVDADPSPDELLSAAAAWRVWHFIGGIHSHELNVA